MILAFADDSTVRVFDTIEQANGYCEAIDVENREYTFLDDRGCVLNPVLAPPTKKKLLGFIPTTVSGAFALTFSNERREDLIRKLESGEVSIEPGPTTIGSVDDLRAASPSLFTSRDR